MKTLHNTDSNGATKNVSDIQFFGEVDLFKLLSKASSESEGWMKSTKAMDVGIGCLVQTTTQQRNIDGSYSLTDALAFVPGVSIIEKVDNGKVVGRHLEAPKFESENETTIAREKANKLRPYHIYLAKLNPEHPEELLGTVEANSFQQACDIYFGDDKYYVRETMVYSGYPLFEKRDFDDLSEYKSEYNLNKAETLTLRPETAKALRKFLSNRESDIHWGIEDFVELKDVFEAFIGRKP